MAEKDFKDHLREAMENTEGSSTQFSSAELYTIAVQSECYDAMREIAGLRGDGTPHDWSLTPVIEPRTSDRMGFAGTNPYVQEYLLKLRQGVRASGFRQIPEEAYDPKNPKVTETTQRLEMDVQLLFYNARQFERGLMELMRE